MYHYLPKCGMHPYKKLAECYIDALCLSKFSAKRQTIGIPHLPWTPETVIIICSKCGVRPYQKIATPIAYYLPALEPYHTAPSAPDLFYGHTAGWLVEQHCAEWSQDFKPKHVLDDRPMTVHSKKFL